MSFWQFMYQFWFVDQKQHHISHTKLWSNVGYCILCVIFVYSIVFDKTLDPTLLLVFSGVVIGNRTIAKAVGVHQEQSRSTKL